MATSRRHILGWAAGTVSALLAQLGLEASQAVSALAQAPSSGATGLPAWTSIGPLVLKTGLVVIQVQDNGTGHLTAYLEPPSAALPGSGSGASMPPFLIFDQTGPFKASAATLIPAPGSYYAQLSSPDPCALLVQQPLPEKVTQVQQSTLSGRGRDVSPYFTLPAGISTLSVQTSSTTLRAWLYRLDDSGGEAVQGGVAGPDGRFFDLGATGALTSYPVSLPDSGPYLLAVAFVAPNDTWTFSFS